MLSSHREIHRQINHIPLSPSLQLNLFLSFYSGLLKEVALFTPSPSLAPTASPYSFKAPLNTPGKHEQIVRSSYTLARSSPCSHSLLIRAKCIEKEQDKGPYQLSAAGRGTLWRERTSRGGEGIGGSERTAPMRAGEHTVHTQSYIWIHQMGRTLLIVWPNN